MFLRETAVVWIRSADVNVEKCRADFLVHTLRGDGDVRNRVPPLLVYIPFPQRIVRGDVMLFQTIPVLRHGHHRVGGEECRIASENLHGLPEVKSRASHRYIMSSETASRLSSRRAARDAT